MADSGIGALPAEVVEAMAADRKRPQERRLAPRDWVKVNLFSTPFNTVLTLVFSGFGFMAVRGLLSFIFNPETRWDGTATNMRFLMTAAYPSQQYTRVWVSLGIIIVLAAFSAAAWNAGSRITIHSLARRGLIIAAGIFVVGTLAGDFYLPGLDGWKPAIITLNGRFSVSAQMAYLAVGVALAAVCVVLMRTLDEEASVSSLLVMATAFALPVASLWVVPYGHHAFVEGQVIAEPGTVAATTKGPWSVMVVLLVVAYFVGKRLAGLLGSRLRTIVTLLWLASPLVIVFFVLRDPEFDYDHIVSHELPLFLAHALAGGALLYWLAKPGLGEIGRIIAGLTLLVAAASFLTPMQQVIRITLGEFALFALAAPSFAGAAAARRRYVLGWGLVVGLTIWMVTGINTPSTVETAGFFTGGLTITLIVAVFTLILSFPLGVLLALARTSKLPIFRVMSTIYIEFVRGIPFITILIFFSVMLPLFLPANMAVSEIAAVTIGFTMFSAAYLAENVRGGLQSVQIGQYEAANALGMTTLQRTLFIVLPQALRVSIPPLVGQAIATYKETSLLSIIGLFDLLFIARSLVPAQLDFLGSAQEQLLFASLIYWIGAYSMSKASQRLEQRLGLGER